MSTYRTRAPARIAAAALVIVTLSWAGYLLAHSTGKTGVAQATTGCSCHDDIPNANGAVAVSISGPQAVRPGSVSSYVLTVTGAPAGTSGGFNLKASSGTFTPGTNSKVSNGELTQSTEIARSWTFDWTAPATEGTANFYAVGMCADGSGGSDGDSWNWFGGAVNTPFAITVSSLVDADGSSSELAMSAPWPNPSRGLTRIAFRLAHSGRSRLDIFDISGRHIVALADADLAAGPHVVTWNGRDESGAAVATGSYVVRLESSGATLRTRLTIVR